MIEIKFCGDKSAPEYAKFKEIGWEMVRSERDSLLSVVDKQIELAQDSGVDVAPFQQYRQALRDIPQTYSNPEDVVWPQKPSLPQAFA